MHIDHNTCTCHTNFSGYVIVNHNHPMQKLYIVNNIVNSINNDLMWYDYIIKFMKKYNNNYLKKTKNNAK